MTVHILKRTEEFIGLEWYNSKNGQFGIITIEYNGKGGYTIDAEYLKFETVLEILKHVDL